MKRLPNCYLSVGEVVSITNASRATVQRWLGRGELEVAYTLPSESGHARIELKELRRFLRVNRMPTIEKFLSVSHIKITAETHSFEVEKVVTKVAKKVKKKKRKF